jgi:hypothetical protein
MHSRVAVSPRTIFFVLRDCLSGGAGAGPAPPAFGDTVQQFDPAEHLFSVEPVAGPPIVGDCQAML